MFVCSFYAATFSSTYYTSIQTHRCYIICNKSMSNLKRIRRMHVRGKNLCVHGADEKRLLLDVFSWYAKRYKSDHSMRRRTIPDWSMVIPIGQSSSNRRHLFDTPSFHLTNDCSPTMVRYCGIFHGHGCLWPFCICMKEGICKPACNSTQQQQCIVPCTNKKVPLSMLQWNRT